MYDRVESVFTTESALEKAWKCARLLSMFVYDGSPWDNVAASVVSLSNAQDYFTNTLGFFSNEYNQIKNSICTQHSNPLTPDFAHMQYALAARLACEINLDDELSNWVTLSTDETISYLAGWLGDAVLSEGGSTTIGNDDYCADLDAENVFRLIIHGMCSLDAINHYYSNLSPSNTRASVFLSYISFPTVKAMVFYHLIDKSLQQAINEATYNNNVVLVIYLQGLMADEEYHWDTIKNDYPDTYNFLRSLQDQLPNIAEYLD